MGGHTKICCTAHCLLFNTQGDIYDIHAYFMYFTADQLFSPPYTSFPCSNNKYNKEQAPCVPVPPRVCRRRAIEWEFNVQFGFHMQRQNYNSNQTIEMQIEIT